MTLSTGTKRTIRTAYQGLVALFTVVPIFIALLPADAPLAVQLASVIVAVTGVTKLINKLEDAGVIPAWLKDENTDYEPVDDDELAGLSTD